MDNSKQNWALYVHTNIVNGKKYVGITSRPKPEQRWNNGEGYKDSPRFYNAIKKYGWDNFEHDILFTGLTAEQANQLERHMIASLHTQDEKLGYNLTSGGDGTPGHIPSSETRAKLSNARRKENLSAETLRRRSESLKGRKFSEEHKRKIGKGNSKPVQMLSLNGEVLRTFNSARDVEVELGINHSHISQCCHHKRDSTGGYRWQFAQ